MPTESNKQLYLDVHGASLHAGADKKFNESNPGYGLRYEWQDDDLRKFLMAGQYFNSIEKNSNYVGGGATKRLFGNDTLHLDAGAVAGVITGYGPGVQPAILPLLRVGGKHGAVNMMYAPAIEDVTPATFMLSGQLKLK